MADKLIAPTFAAYLNICNKWEEASLFKKEINEFFKEIVKQNPERFKQYKKLIKNDTSRLEKEINCLEKMRMIIPINKDLGVYQIYPGMIHIYNNMDKKEKEFFDKIGESFYSNFGCNTKGIIGRHSFLKKKY